MSYKGWKMMEKLDVAVRNRESTDNRYDFTGYIVEHGDKSALNTATEWARIGQYDYENKIRKEPIEPNIYTFDNEGFTATILDSAGGSSQGGHLSFWRVKVEKDGVEFTIGVNDAILADLIKNSDISNGKIKQKLMFARKGGQPGLIHEKMDAYKDATADMKHKADMKAIKKTSVWERGGIYSSITQNHVCLGEVWDHYEEYFEQTNTSWYGRKEKMLRKRDKPVKVRAWINYEDGKTLGELLKAKLDRSYTWLNAGKPPSRAKTKQLEVTDEDLKLIDKLLAENIDHTREYGGHKIKGRYTRVK